MTNPYSIAPLDPPPTETELAWWQPRQRRARLRGYATSILVWGGFGLAIVEHNNWRVVFAHPLPSVAIATLVGASTTLLYRVVFGKMYQAIERTMMTKAIRDRRVREALLVPPG
jgi:hypothetical protein